MASGTAHPPLTARQRDVYAFIRGMILNRGYGPTVREIGAHFGLRTPNAAMNHLKALEKKGLITREPNLSRAIQLAKPPKRTTSLPLAGEVVAGHPVLAEEQKEKVDFVTLFDGDDVVVLHVGDSSLTEAGFAEGDHLVVRRTTEWRDGDAVVCIPDGKDATVRRLYRDGKRFRLESPTGTGKPTVVRDVEVIGVVRGMVRVH